MREIKGYEGLYAINENSEIINLKTKHIKHPSLGNTGYLMIDLFKNNSRKTFLVHRLMTETFLENPDNKATVNHKDGNKTNNNLNNLEWATYSENAKHSYEYLGRQAWLKGKYGVASGKGKPIIAYTKDGDIVRRFESIMDAQREWHILNNAIVACLKGKSKSAGGYIWRYAQ